MRRTTARATTIGVSLFPFLAVLLCTMGALILVLFTVARQARADAEELAHAGPIHKNALTDKEKHELVTLRIEQLREQRAKTEHDLDDERLRAGQIEDHIRQLQDQLASRETAQRQLDAGRLDPRRRAELSAELAAIERRVAATKDALDRLRDARQAAPSYAVVPYHGPGETRRRPIYIECRENAIVLQPESLVLTEGDFVGPLGPGNPLAAAVRATRECLIRRRNSSAAEPGDPYPLLLVRPRGTAAYYVARAALESWGSQFGYELIDEDWQLEFNAPDAEIAEAQRVAAEQARQRQLHLARAAPRKFKNVERPSFRYDGESDVHGGLDPASGLGGGDTGHGGFLDSGANHTIAGRATNAPGRPRSADTLNSEAEGRWDARSGSSQLFPTEAPLGGALSSRDRLAPGIAGAADGQPSGHGRPGETAPSADFSSVNRNDTRQPNTHSAHASQANNLSQRRGENWALPEAARDAVAITRPIRVACDANRLTLHVDRPGGAPRVIEMQGSTADVLDELVSAVWDHMRSWGIAGKGMYWRPILSFEVAPEGRARFSELTAVLQGSGFVVRERP